MPNASSTIRGDRDGSAAVHRDVGGPRAGVARLRWSGQVPLVSMSPGGSQCFDEQGRRSFARAVDLWNNRRVIVIVRLDGSSCMMLQDVFQAAVIGGHHQSTSVHAQQHGE